MYNIVQFSLINFLILLTSIGALKIGTSDYYRARVRRSLSSGYDAKCRDVLGNETETKIMKFAFPLRNDANMDLQLEFVGEKNERQLLLTTMSERNFFSFFQLFRHQSSTSNLYESSDGGRTFQKLDKEINSASIRSRYGIMISPLDHNWVILVSFTTNIFGSGLGFGSMLNIQSMLKKPESFLLISQNGCKNFTWVKVPFKLRTDEPLLFHPRKKSWIIGLEQKVTVTTNKKTTHYGHAFISKDFGKTWTVMMEDYIAETVKWGAVEGKEGDEIYISTHSTGQEEGKPKTFTLFSLMHESFSSAETLSLWRSSDGGIKFEKIIDHCYRFGVEGSFVFASIVLNVSNGENTRHKRVMHLSKDSGGNFHRVFIPEITDNEFYAVMEMYKKMIIIHVDEKGNTGKGTLYISGEDGLMYTKSLDNHFYTDRGQHDFTKIESMPGVYITQTLTKENTLRSVITFDRGVSWQPLYVDKNKYCTNTSGICTLHFHKVYSNAQTNSDLQGPLSSSNAPGIIILHGQAGDALTGAIQVWLSTNGGYNWTRIADNPHHYAIGDNGNLIVLVPRFNNTGNVLKYSIDQGKCWHDYKFSDDNQPMVIRGLVTEPHSKDRTFSLWGYLKVSGVSEKEWNVITIKFHGMFARKCEPRDLDEWSPHLLNGKGGCFLGEKLFYARPKQTVACYLGNDFKSLLRSTRCTCTRDDMECDYGYVRNTHGKCEKDGNIKPIEICQNGEEMKKTFTKGYRRVPGDVCDTSESIDSVKYIDEKKICDQEKIVVDSFGVVKEEKKVADEIEKEQQQSKEFSKESMLNNKSSHKIKPISVVLAVLTVVVIIVGAGWYGVKYYMRKLRSARHSYVMSGLADNDDDDDERDCSDLHLYNPKPKSQRPYKDESDVDDDSMLQV